MKRDTSTSKGSTSKYGALIQKAKSTENQNASKPENQLSGLPDEAKQEVNLSIRVPKHLRRHWVSEAKRQDTTLTAVITSLLQEKFGDPSEN